MLSNIIDKKFIAVTGKGGVGKTTVAASIARYAQDSGKKVLFAEWAARSQIGPLFGLDQLRHQETELPCGLFLINLDPRHCFQEYVVDHLGLKKLYDKVFDHRLVKSFLQAMPGLAETMLLGRFYYSCVLAKNYDLVVFDAPASGHYLQLLTTPQAVLKTGIVGPLVREIENIHKFLEDPSSTSLYVSIPEPLVVSETMDFVPKIIKHSPLQLDSIILNRVQDGILAAKESFSQVGSMALERYFSELAGRQQQALQQLTQSVKSHFDMKDLYLVQELQGSLEPFLLEHAQAVMGVAQ